VDIFRLVRGVAVLVEQKRDWIESSELSILLRSGHYARRPFSLTRNTEGSTPEVEVQLQSLLKHCQKACKDSNSMSIYLSSIEALISGYTIFSTTSDSAMILAWPVLVDSRFLELLLQKDQLALVIFAHYGTVMTLLSEVWWLRGWGNLVISLTSDQQVSGH
jgi:hypothetical protein